MQSLAAVWPRRFHGALIDPPYLIDFMNRAFDRQHRDTKIPDALRNLGWNGEAIKAVLWSLEWLRPLYRALVPGAYAGIFQGSKTYHRAAFAAELAGFRVEPMVVGLTGQAMAQGLELGKGIDREVGAERHVTGRQRRQSTGFKDDRGQRSYSDSEFITTAPASPLARDFDDYHSRLKDQLMPILLVQKPPEGSLARNAMKWGVGGLNVGDARIEAAAADVKRTGQSTRGHTGPTYGEIGSTGGPDISRGRFPGNVLLDSAAAEEVGEMSGERPAGGSIVNPKSDIGYSGGLLNRSFQSHADTGTAARFFRQFHYVGRANEEERRRGLEHWHWQGDPNHPEGWRRLAAAEAIELRRTKPGELISGSNHPTMKPLELTRWLGRLILPPMGPEATAIRFRTTGSRGRLLIPFSGVLSEAIGAALAGWSEIVAIEKSASYVAQGACRWRARGPYSVARAETIERDGGIQKERTAADQLDLFAELAW